jgi:hypothetical protein
MNSQKTECILISPMMQVFGCEHKKGKIFLQPQWKGLGLIYETKSFLSSLAWIPILSLFCPSSQKSQITERCSKNANLTNRIIKQDFSGSRCFTTPETAEVCQVLQEGMIL